MATSSQGCFERPPILQLSQELIDEIIDNTPELKDLKSLSLVCWAFHPRCEKHIFASIMFDSDDAVGWDERATRIQEFINILSRKPYIASYVRELHLGLEGRDQEWIVDDSGFLKIMDLIRHSAARSPLNKFELSGNIFQQKKIINPRRFAESFCTPFITPFLSSLCIEDLDDVPLTLVTDCVNLKSLDIVRTTFGGLDLVKNMNTSQSYPELEVLRFDQCTRGIDTLLQREVSGSRPFINISKLRIIKTNVCWLENMKILQDLLDMSSASLEELYLKLQYAYTDFKDLSERLDLGTLFQLHVLHVDILFTLPGSYTGLTSVCKLLKTISSANVLEELKIQLFMGNFWMRPKEVKTADWAFLDHEVRRVSSGKPLEFHLHLLHDTTDEDEDDPESEDEFTHDDDDDDDDSNSSHCPENGDPITAFDDKRALSEQTFRKIVDKKLPMIRSDPNIILHLKINPECQRWFDGI